MKEACLDHGMGAEPQHHVVRSGFDLRRFAEASPPDDWPDILGQEPGEARPPVVVMLAALEPRKRHLDLLDHLPALSNGPPAFASSLPARATSRTGSQPSRSARPVEPVSLLGFREDPERIIAMADVCIHCADKEGLPRSVLQYLAAGGRP